MPTISGVHGASSWSFGWDALVAIGTLGLAMTTGALAWMTWRLARAAAAEARSQSRPALIPGAADWAFDPDPRRLHHDLERQRLTVNIRNAGRGPALFVRVSLEPSGGSPTSGPRAAMGPGDEVQLVFEGEAEARDRWQILLDYRDLAGRSYATAVLIESSPTLRFYDVRTFEDRSITPHADALAQEGVTDFTG
jgi:hypothetical protein